jgi:hypothetical protein
MKCFIMLPLGKHISVSIDTWLLNWDTNKTRNVRVKIRFIFCGTIQETKNSYKIYHIKAHMEKKTPLL